MSNQPTSLILPVESQVRELDAKLLLAASAAEKGFPVIIGSRFYIHFALPFLPRGVVFAKSMRNVSAVTLDLTRRLGHDVVAWDEEGLVRFSSPEYYSWRYSKRAFTTAKCLFCWGDDDAEFFKSYPGYNGAPIHVTGNPRMDLLRENVREFYAEEVSDLREKFGEFILVNTNFSFANNFVKDLNLVQSEPGNSSFTISRTGRGLSRDFAKGMSDHQQRIFAAFRKLVPMLSARFPEKTIVIRPHPSENHNVWRDLARDQQNVYVLREGNVVPWLMACGVLLHNGCTTAVEAAVLGTPAISYLPVRSDIYDYALPNSLSHQAETIEETISLLDDVVSGRRGLIPEDARMQLIACHLASTTGALACDRVVETLAAAGYLTQPIPRPALGNLLIGWIGMNGRTLLQRLNMQRPNSRHSRAHHAHRFPDITAAELNTRISRMGKLLGRFGRVRAEPLADHIFSIKSVA
jgi:surface carbohydrate biosynthesis protein